MLMAAVPCTSSHVTGHILGAIPAALPCLGRAASITDTVRRLAFTRLIHSAGSAALGRARCLQPLHASARPLPAARPGPLNTPDYEGGYSSPDSGSPTVSPCLPSQQGQAQLWSMLPGL